MNQVSVTTAPLNRLVQGMYYDIKSTIDIMKRIWAESAVDGFEFQKLAEWESDGPPRDDNKEFTRRDAWRAAPKYTVKELSKLLKQSNVPILSVHANRDVGICLCSNDSREIARGKDMMHETLALARNVGAGVAVFHLWDTWKEEFSPAFLRDLMSDVASQYPTVIAAVENVPTHLVDHTPFDLVKEFEYVTLDTRWAAMYDELDKFESIKDRIINIHLRGHLENEWWAIDNAPFTFDEALTKIQDSWRYRGLLTLEPERGPSDVTWECLLVALRNPRNCKH